VRNDFQPHPQCQRGVEMTDIELTDTELDLTIPVEEVEVQVSVPLDGLKPDGVIVTVSVEF